MGFYGWVDLGLKYGLKPNTNRSTHAATTFAYMAESRRNMEHVDKYSVVSGRATFFGNEGQFGFGSCFPSNVENKPAIGPGP